MEPSLRVVFYDVTGVMRWDSITVAPGEVMRIPDGAVTAEVYVTDTGKAKS